MATTSTEMGLRSVLVDRWRRVLARLGTVPRALGRLLGRNGLIDARNTAQLAVGAILAPVGLVIILIAWYGSAHTAYVQQQIPYLVSGSFIGLGLMILGGLLFWAHWIFRIYDQADLHHKDAMEFQEKLFQRLIEAVAQPGLPDPIEPAHDPVLATAGTRSNRRSGAASTAAGRPVQPVPPANGKVALVVTANGTSAHRPDCPIVARHPRGVRRLSVAEASEHKPCRVCNA